MQEKLCTIARIGRHSVCTCTYDYIIWYGFVGWEDDGAHNGREGDGEGKERGEDQGSRAEQAAHSGNELGGKGGGEDEGRSRTSAPDVGGALQRADGGTPRRCRGESDW